MKYDVKAKCQNCGETFILHECLLFEYGPNDDIGTKEEWEELAFVKKPVGEHSFCDKCKNIAGIISKKFYDSFGFSENKFWNAKSIENCQIPNTKGVYLIVYCGKEMPAFVYASPAGKRINKTQKDPTVSKETLENKWVKDASVLYIGKHEKSLTKRMKQHIHFWGGKDGDSAWGGRMIAQIKDCKNLQVWYMECDNPTQKEKELLALFIDKHKKLPFANLRR